MFGYTYHQEDLEKDVDTLKAEFEEIRYMLDYERVEKLKEIEQDIILMKSNIELQDIENEKVAKEIFRDGQAGTEIIAIVNFENER